MSARIPASNLIPNSSSSRKLLVGAPGTGKTSHCIDRFRDTLLKSEHGLNSRAFFVLPSREHADRIAHLTLKKDLPGIFNFNILTLDDLALKLLNASGVHVKTVGDSLRSGVLSHILSDPKFTFGYFEPIKNDSGFLESLSDTVKEFESSLLSVSELEKRCQSLLTRKGPGGEAFRLKFRDFSIVLKNYRQALKNLGQSELDAQIPLLSALKLKDPLDLLIFDGFYDFTPAQRKLIELSAKISKETLVTLTLPLDNAREQIFEHAFRTKKFLIANGFKTVATGQVSHRTRLEPLVHLEQNLFLKTNAKAPSAGDIVTVISAPNRRMEVEMIAREIRSIYRDSGIHFSDFCLIFRKIGSTETVLRQVFEDFEIPLAIHERKKLSDSGWVLEILKSLENTATPENPLPFLESVSAAQFTAHFLNWARLFRKKVNVKESETRAVRAFENICRTLAETPHPNSENFNPLAFVDKLKAALQSALYSEKALSRNAVQVYDAVMALPKEYKVVFIGGLNEGEFPKRVLEDPIFKDDERASMNHEGLAFEERSLRESGEKYFFYMAVTRAKEKLFLSTSQNDSRGRPILPSFFIEEVRQSFSAIREIRREAALLISAPDEWVSAVEMRLGAADLGPRLPEFQAILKDPAILERFKNISVFSATKLETFATCAFKYFVQRILSLNEPLEGRENLIIGSLLHKTLEEFYRSLSDEERKSKLFWQSSSVVSEKLETFFNAIWKEDAFVGTSNFRKQIIRENILKTLKLFAEREAELVEKRSVYAQFFELRFGGDVKKRDLDYLTLKSIEPPVQIEGQIDRIDHFEGTDEALVIDYKKSARSQTIGEKIEKGLELQMPIYLMALERLLGLKPAGAELRFLESGKEEGLYADWARETLGFTKAKRMVSHEALHEILVQTEETIGRLVKNLRSGDIRVKPKSCQFCQMDAICRFEKWKLVYEKP